MELMRGKIRNIRDDKDFAFIVSGVNRDIFLHRAQFRGNWDELRALHTKALVEVEFTPQETAKGLRAVNCRVVE